MDNSTQMMMRTAEGYKAKYGEQLALVGEHFESMYGNYKSWDESVDAYAIGKYCETVSEYLPVMMEAAGTTPGNLGDMLKSSMGLVAAQYATSIIPFIGTTQPAEQEIAVIYYKRALAVNSRGTIDKNDVVMNEFGKFNPNMDDYTSTEVVKDVAALSLSTKKATINLLASGATSGVQPGTLAFTVTSNDGQHVYTGQDSGKKNADGKGIVFGTNVDPDKSTIDYDKGVLEITFIDDTHLNTNDGKFSGTFTEIVISGDVIPSFKYDLRSESLPVKYWPIQTTYDQVSDFIARKKFGQTLNDLASRDLLTMINNIVSYNAIKQLRAAAIKNESYKPDGKTALGAVTWSTTPAAGVSLIDHRRTFEDIYEIAHARMEKITGLGGVSAIICGSEGRKIYRALGMADIERGKAGAYVLGFFQGIPVIYAPTEVLPADEVLLIYKGDDWFSVPLVYAPFLPVMTVQVQGRLENVFQKQMGIAHGAGIRCVNGGFVQRVTLTK